MKVGIDVSQAVYGTGVSDYTIDLFNALKSNYPLDQFIPVGFSLRRQDDLVRLFPHIKKYPIPPTLLDILWNQWHSLDFETFSGQVDVYHSSDWTQAPGKAKKVTTIHDLAPILYPNEHDPQIVAVHSRRLALVAKECDAVICVSQNTAHDFETLYKYPKSKIYVIPEALPSRFLLKPNKNIDGDYIVAIGARQHRKNIDRLISAHEKYQKKYKLPKLIIIGEGKLGTGYVSDQRLVDLLANAKCFVYPSLYEGFGLPILGAFHHHVPIACSDIAPFREVGGNSVTYFDPNSEEQIALAITQAKSSSNQLQKFSWTRTATETMKVYKSIC